MESTASNDPLPAPGGTELEGQLAGRKGLEYALTEREEFYRSVLESLAEGVLITNHESRIIYANSKLADLTGYSKDELLGRVSYKLLAPQELWPAMEQRLKERLEGKTEVYENEMVRRDGGRHWVLVRATPYRNRHGEIIGTVGAIICIEKQKSLELENEYLLDEIRTERNFGDIIGGSGVLCKVIEQIKMVAPTPANVLILGESGTGKELVARAVHDLSERKGRPLVRVNCASIPKELFESEFFGHVRGAFTGAIKDRVGRFELADGGTLFLDEIGEIPLDLQSKLLRVLQEGQFERVGDDRTRNVNVRLIAATNRNLMTEAKAGRFRLDLYYRLSVFPIELPPLRERREDIGPLTEHFIRVSAKRMGVSTPRLTKGQVRELEAYDWPGNVRELQNVVERAVILARDGRLQFELGGGKGQVTPLRPAMPLPAGAVETVSLSDLKAQEREMILRALAQTNGKISGAGGAAELLGLRPTTLASKVKRWGLR
jgi:formate hydrogenlyase transcriptional activator